MAAAGQGPRLPLDRRAAPRRARARRRRRSLRLSGDGPDQRADLLARRTCSRACGRQIDCRARRSVHYGREFTVATLAPNSIAKVSLVRLGSMTHAFDLNQRLRAAQLHRPGSGLDRAGTGQREPWRLPATTCSSSSTPTACRRSRRCSVPAPPARHDVHRRRPPGRPRPAGSGRVNLSLDAPPTDNGGVSRYDVFRSTTSGFTPRRRTGRAGDNPPTGHRRSPQAPTTTGSTPRTWPATSAPRSVRPGHGRRPTRRHRRSRSPRPLPGATVQQIITVSANASDNSVLAPGVQVQARRHRPPLGARDFGPPTRSSGVHDNGVATGPHHVDGGCP